jgi:MATE family multidrug resistance protein
MSSTPKPVSPSSPNSISQMDIALPDQSGFVLRFFRLAIVNVLSNLMVPLAGLLSVAFLGHLSEIRHLAGVTLATVLFNYIYRTLGFLRMGTTGVTAQAVGRNDSEAALLTGLRNGVLALGLGMLLLVLQVPLREIGFALLSAAPDVKAAGQAYYDARIWAAPATLLNFVLIGWFLGREQSGRVLLLSLIGNGVNILLDYWLIVRCGWESAGAGLATTFSQYAMAIAGLSMVLLEIELKDLRAALPHLLDAGALYRTLTLNGNIFIRTLAFLSTFSVFTSLSSLMGTITLSQNALLLQVITLAVYIIDGLAYATESLTGIFKGQGVQEPLRSLVWLAGGSSLLIGLSCAGLFVMFPESLFSLLTNHSEVIRTIDREVIWLLPVLGFGSLAFMLDGYFLGLAEGATLRNAALIASVFGFAPLATLAWQQHSSTLLWLGMTVFMAARVILLGLQVPRTLEGSDSP